MRDCPEESAVSPAGTWQLVWSDEFDGDALDLDKWNIQTGDGTAYGIPGWGNNELQSYRPGNVAVRDGRLVVTARAEAADGKRYTSGRINTRGKFETRYGRIEASIRVPAGQGLWAAFWMLPTNSPYGGWAASGEIDIMEAFSRRPEPFIQGAAHFGMAWPLNAHVHRRGFIAPHDPAEGFHTYAVEWDRCALRWFAAGLHYWTVPSAAYWTYYLGEEANAHRSGPEGAPFDQPFHLLLNLAVGGNLPGDPVAAAFPGEMRVDWVRVYRCGVDETTGEGCAGSMDRARADAHVEPASDVYRAEYVLYADGLRRLAARGTQARLRVDDGDRKLNEAQAPSLKATKLRLRVNGGRGGLTAVEVDDAARGRVLEVATSGGGQVAIVAEERLRFFGMGSAEDPAKLAGELHFDLFIDGVRTHRRGRLRIGLDSGGGSRAGAVELPLAGLPRDRWIPVAVQVSDIAHNPRVRRRPLSLRRVRSLFALEPTRAARLRVDNVRIVCGHSQPNGGGIGSTAGR